MDTIFDSTNEPKITVVTVIKNIISSGRGKYFEQCVESVSLQAYKNKEHLIVDAASIDGTVELLELYSEKFGITYISEPDKGMYYAMNKGIDYARGEYILFLNSDDYFHDFDGLSLSIKAIQQSAAKFSFAEAHLLEDGIHTQNIRAHPANACLCMPFCHQTLLVEKAVLMQEGMFDTHFKSASDYDLILRLFIKGYRYDFVETPFVTFRSGGFSSTDALISRQECREIHKKIYGVSNHISHLCYDEYIMPQKLFDDIKQKASPQWAKDLKNLRTEGYAEGNVKVFTEPYSTPVKSKKSYGYKQRCLLVYHNNIYEPKGCNVYVYDVINFLKEKGISCDLFGITSFVNNWDSFYEQNSKKQLFNNCFIYSDELHIDNHTLELDANKYYGWMNASSLNYFQSILNEHYYDYIYINYTQMSACIRNTRIPSTTKRVYCFHDSAIHQHFFQRGLHNDIGDTFYNELNDIYLYDAVMCVSNEEKLFYEKFFPHIPFCHVPSLMEFRKIDSKRRDIDVLFIGFKNKYNIDGLLWFIDYVLMPHSRIKLRFAVAGIIADILRDEYPAQYSAVIEKTDFVHLGIVDNLDELYGRTKISICPLHEGTGIKIKVLDSLSRGVPVVTTERGIDGFPDRQGHGCLVTNNPSHFAQMIEALLSDENFYEQTLRITSAYFKDHLSKQACSHHLDSIFYPKAFPESSQTDKILYGRNIAYTSATSEQVDMKIDLLEQKIASFDNTNK